MTSKTPTSSVRTRRRRSRDRLDSWKEIAAYLHRSVRTARRWELHEGLPVRRHQHLKRGSVYAFKVEIDDWRRGREAARDSRPSSRTRRHPSANAGPPRRARPRLHIVGGDAARASGQSKGRQARDSGRVTLEDILSSCSDLICVFDRDSRYLLSSRAGAEALGLDRERMIGRNWRELGLPAEAMAPFHRHVKEVFARGRSIRTEVSYPTLLGHQTYEYILDPIRADGEDEVTAVLAIVRAIANGR